MIRYLLHVSYIGTSYRGVTAIEPYYSYRDLRFVQGAIENAVKFLFKKRCEVNCSSRTDARVHALNSTFHVDVTDPRDEPFETAKYEMMAVLNENFKYARGAVRVNDIEIVDATKFEAHRNVESRTYMYRIAIAPNDSECDEIFPIEEVNRCHIIRSDNFDIDKMMRCAKLFKGKHDFRSFMQFSKEEKTQGACYAQRKMYNVSVEESKPCLISSNLRLCEKRYRFYDIKFTANAFVYRQIRRIIGALCAVGQGQITERDIYELLTIPSHKAWIELFIQKKVETAPAGALYFMGLNYKAEDLWTLAPAEHNARGVRVKSFFEDFDQVHADEMDAMDQNNDQDKHQDDDNVSQETLNTLQH